MTQHATLQRVAKALERIAASLEQLTATSVAPVVTAQQVNDQMGQRRARLERAAVIRLNHERLKEYPDGNPKRPGSAAWHLFALYKDGMTVGEYVEAVLAQPYRSTTKDAFEALRWDIDYDFITVSVEEEEQTG